MYLDYITKILKCERIDGQVTGFQIDSRLIKKENLFFALKGQKYDGHNFLGEVAKKGGKAAVVDKRYRGESFKLTLLRVEDVKMSLQALAKEVVKKKRGKIVAITGSVGKTTTKEFVAQILKKRYRVFKSPQSYNSQITMPLNILNSQDEQVLVLEMAMSEKGQIANLVDIAPPDIAVITKLALAHVENFEEGKKGIAKAKAEIMSKGKTKLAVVNREIFEEYGDILSRYGCKKLSFSINKKDACFYLKGGDKKVQIYERGENIGTFFFPYLESHLLEDFIAAIAVARSLNLSIEDIKSTAKNLMLPKMRFEKFERGGIFFINDAYNANPTSTISALANLPKVKGRKIAVLGEMKELGKYSKRSHEMVGKYAAMYVDVLLCIGKGCRSMYRVFKKTKNEAEIFFDMEDLANRLKGIMKRGDLVLVKGQRVMALDKIFDLL